MKKKYLVSYSVKKKENGVIVGGIGRAFISCENKNKFPNQINIETWEERILKNEEGLIAVLITAFQEISSE
jgi:hypothetical protein